MSDFEIIEAKPEHAETVCTILIRSIKEICAPDYNNDKEVLFEWLKNKTPDNVKDWIQSPLSYSVVAVTGRDEVIGFAQILKNEIMLNYVLPEYLHKGIGRAMLLSLEEYAVNQRFESLLAVSTITAKKFYKRNGFFLNGKPEYVGSVLGDFPMIKALIQTKSPH